MIPAEEGNRSDDLITASCHCGKVQFQLARKPAEVTECNCSLCRRYGVLWAYYDAGEIEEFPETGTTDTYAWARKNVDFHRCSRCGCISHWAPRSPSRTRYGINARLLPPAVLATAIVRQKDGAGSGKPPVPRSVAHHAHDARTEE